MIDAYPLAWPEGWAREEKQKPAAFNVTLSEARAHLLNELERLGAENVIISCNVR